MIDESQEKPTPIIVRLSKASIAFAMASFILPFAYLIIGLAFATKLTWPLDSETAFLLIPTAIMLSVGVLGACHLVGFLLFRSYRGELHFDGITVISKVAGKAPQSFTQPDVLAYFPHRNEVLLVDGKRVRLPDCAPHLYYNDIEMATPWVNAWWPGLDLPAAISAGEKAQGWIRHAPNGINVSILATILYSATIQPDLGFSITFAALFVMIFLPGWVEARLRRRVMITFENAPATPSSQAPIGASQVLQTEQIHHDRP